MSKSAIELNAEAINSLKLREAIEINADSAAKQKISPVGNAIGFDGRNYLINGATLAQTAVNRGVKIPLLVEHGYGKNGGEAAGWINPNEIEVRDGGLYAAIEKNALGEELISSKAYLYYSPAYRCDYVENSLIVKELIEVSLTNTPNLAMPEANDAKPAEPKPQEGKDGGEKQAEANALSELNALKAQIDEINAQTQAQIAEANKRLNDAQSKLTALANENKTLKVDLAIERLKILPKDREFALSLNGDQLEAYIRRSDNGALDRLTQKSAPIARPNDNRQSRFVRLAINPKNKGVK
jgi:hypothetical protein